ncbi:hypothetical protein ACSBR1_001558 [Camellia fascicularis]
MEGVELLVDGGGGGEMMVAGGRSKGNRHRFNSCNLKQCRWMEFKFMAYEMQDISKVSIWAPLFEVQTDNWECFHAILWDPAHADCAVPQELDTDQVLKHLKYIEMLRPWLAAEKRKLDGAKNVGPRDFAEHVRNIQTL